MSSKRKNLSHGGWVIDEEENMRRNGNNIKTRKRKRGRKHQDKEEKERKRIREIERLKTWSNELLGKKGMREKLERIKELKEDADHEKLAWYGDKIEEDNGWPKETAHGCIRIYSQNINGTPAKSDFIDWEMLLNNINDLQVDVVNLSDINLDLNNAEVVHKLMEKAKRMDKHMKMITTTSKTTAGTSVSKRGGTMSMIRGNWAGHVKSMSKDKLGRWTSIEMVGKKGKIIKIISTYRVCDQRYAQGNCTVYLQQQLDLIQEKRENTDPREVILEDLSKMIATDHSQGKIVILCGDMNENIGESKKLKTFLEENDLYNAVEVNHQGLYPATYDRGKHCLDWVAISNSVDPKAIKRSGYLPFYEGYVSDHRALYIDIDAKQLFTNAKPNTNRDIYKRFTTDRVKKCEKYIKGLETYIREARVDTKVSKLKTEMEHYQQTKFGNIDEMIVRCKTLFEKVTQLMTASEKRVGRKHYPSGYPFSRKLKEAGDKVFHARKVLRYESTKENSNEKKMNEYIVELKESKRELQQVQNNAIEEREQDLLELAEKRAEEWNITATKAILVIKESEASKKTHRKQKAFLKPKREGNIQRLLVPAPREGITAKESNITDTKTQCWVDDPQEIFNIILRQNFRSLLKSEESIFSKGELMERIDSGTQEDEENIDRLMKGIFPAETLEKQHEKYGNTLDRFLNSIKRATNREGDNIEDFKWAFGKEEYKATFKKTKEATSCGPSGLHMSHWKAAVESDMLMEIHSFFIWAAFAFGFSYPRWEQSWHCMLKKKKEPYSQKLRIIQLFEGDLNGGLKYILGRILMWHLHENGMMDDEIYGSRVGKTGAEALISLQLIADYARTWKLNLAVLYNDADGCFDRIPPKLAELALMRIGCPTKIAKTHTEIQRKMRHYVKTAFGVSEGYFQYSKELQMIMLNGLIMLITGLIGGVGQGGGSSPIIWMAVLMIMMMAFKMTQKGADMYDPLTKEKTTYWLTSYVDDNTIVRYFDRTCTMESIMRTMAESLSEWMNLLRITGGDLSLGKCKVTVMRWKKTGWRNKMILESKQQAPGTVQIQKEKNSEDVVQLERLEPWQSERILGLRLPLTGSMQAEMKHRTKKLTDFGEKFYKAPLNNYEALTAFQTRYKPMAKYPLPVTMFTTNELNEMQKKCVYRMLPKMGLNRHTPRVVVYGPRKMGGLQLMDMRVEQPTLHLETTMGHLRRGQKIGKALMITLRNLQIEVGTSKPFYTLDPNLFQYITPNTRWGYFWKVAYEKGLHAEMYNYWTPKPSYHNDRNIMEVAVEDKYFRQKNRFKLESINKCRMHLQVFFISEMETRQGLINERYLNGTTKYHHPEVIIPLQENPTATEWKDWKEFIFRNFLKGAYKIHPPLTQHLVVVKYDKGKNEFKEIKNGVKECNDLEQAFMTLPDDIKLIMGTAIIPDDSGQDLALAIRSGNIIGASDGSLQQREGAHIGGHAYSLQRWSSDSKRLIGYGRTPDASNMTSTTTEYFGILAVVISAVILQVKYNINEQLNPIQVFSDNEEVINKANNKEPILNISEYNKADTDLWQLLQLLLRNTNLRFTFTWVKGHQNVDKQGKKIFGPFERPVQLNILMDEYAGRGVMLEGEKNIKRPTYSTTKISFYNKQNIQLQDLREHITMQALGEELKDYVKKKNG